MMNKACLVLIIAMCPATLFAGVTMVTRTTQTTRTTRCDFRVDKCETSVATDPCYFHFKDGRTPLAPVGYLDRGDPSYYSQTFIFHDYVAVPRQPTVEELVDLIRSKLSNCPEVAVSYDEDTGDITVHYLKTNCDCNCDWVVNVRDVKADDFVWQRTTDNYSPYLGQMERRKFHCLSQEDAQKIETACEEICRDNVWPMDK